MGIPIIIIISDLFNIKDLLLVNNKKIEKQKINATSDPLVPLIPSQINAKTMNAITKICLYRLLELCNSIIKEKSNNQGYNYGEHKKVPMAV